jgi:hypothetical protein
MMDCPKDDVGSSAENGNTNKKYRDDKKIECPCHKFTALSKIVDILSSEDRTHTDECINWLNGSTDEVAIRHKKVLSCGKRFQCRYRYGTSFAILRAIRDACAPFQLQSTTIPLATSTSMTTTAMTTRPASKEIKPVVSYDHSFPPLEKHPGVSNILIPPSAKKNQSDSISLAATGDVEQSAMVINTLQTRKKKSKRRIQPQLISAATATATATPVSSDTSNSIWELKDTNRSTEISKGNVSHQSIDVTHEKMTPTKSSVNNTEGDVEQSAMVINTLQTRKKKSKQRIQPQLVAAVTTTTVSPDTSNSIWESKDTVRPNESSEATKSSVNDTEETIERMGGLNVSHQSIVVTHEKFAPTKPPVNNTDEMTERMDRLVDIYVALIKNMLVPSTPLEIHLLLELLLIDMNSNNSPEQDSQQKQQQQQQQIVNQSSKDNDTNDSSKGSILFFQPIFSCPDQCIQFSKSALTKLQKGLLQRLSPFLIKSLLGDESFTRRCPAIAENLNISLGKIPTTEYTPPTPESIRGTHAMFNLPFEPDRDSRNNFKTTAEIAMYQNREVSRDAFLSQLRLFMTAKSKVFLPEQVDKVRETAQYESRKIIHNISSHNLMWFAQFFCDLLLQVGLSPVEEMDQELLKIVADDRDKLQKLHSRFSKKNPSRSSQTRTGFASSTTATGRRRNNSNNTKNSKACTDSPLQEALSSYFPGYQEFFFIFLYSVNSYNFGMHLLHQIAKKTCDLILNHSPSGFEKRTMDLALLARFLGFLVFSPNWHEESIDGNKLKPFICSYDCGLNLLVSIGLPISKIVQEAWEGGYTFLVVPWVTELLKMSKWDTISQSSMTFRQILANLRLIQSDTSSDENMASGSSMQLVSFHLETFFNETISLPKLTSLPDATLSRLSQVIPDSLDNHKIRLSTAAIYASSPYMEDLSDMIMHINSSTRQPVKTPNTKPKKLRPSIVSTTVGIEARSYLGVESPSFGKATSPLRNGSWLGLPSDNTLDGKRLHTLNKLTEGFFHQHRDLKEICDFTVEQTIKTLSIKEVNVFVMKAFEEHSIGVESTEREIEETQFRAFQLSQYFLRNKLRDKLKKSLELFCPPDAQHRVIGIAVNLSIDRGMNSSQVAIRGLVFSSTKIILKELESKTKAPNCKKDERKQIEDAIEACTSSIRNLQNTFLLSPDSNSKIGLLQEALDCVEILTKLFSIPSEKLLRDFFVLIIDLDGVAESIIHQAIQSDTSESWIMLVTLFCLLSHLSSISGYWRTSIPDLFGEDYIHLLSNCKPSSPNEKKMLLEQLAELTERRKYPCITEKKEKNGSTYVGIIDPVAIQFQ